MIDLKPLVHRILDDYALRWDGTHGVGHWARVLENGLRLADATGAKIEVVQLFAILHDSRRVSDGLDDGQDRGNWLRLPMTTIFPLTVLVFVLADVVFHDFAPEAVLIVRNTIRLSTSIGSE